eukprot:scaffold162632_cov21-Cyclotella_meneghiniana.AAC.1
MKDHEHTHQRAHPALSAVPCRSSQYHAVSSPSADGMNSAGAGGTMFNFIHTRIHSTMITRNQRRSTSFILHLLMYKSICHKHPGNLHSVRFGNCSSPRTAAFSPFSSQTTNNNNE